PCNNCGDDYPPNHWCHLGRTPRPNVLKSFLHTTKRGGSRRISPSCRSCCGANQAMSVATKALESEGARAYTPWSDLGSPFGNAPEFDTRTVYSLQATSPLMATASAGSPAPSLAYTGFID